MMFEFLEKDINSWYYHSNFRKALFVDNDDNDDDDDDDDDSGNISS